MAVRRDQIQVSVEIDAKQGVREYQKLLDESRNINNEMRKLQRAGKENSEEFKKLAERAKGVNKALGDLGGAEANFGQLLNRSKQLNRELRSLTPGTERFIAASGELREVNTRIKAIRDETRAVNKNLGQMQTAGGNIPPVFQRIGTAVSMAMKAFFALQIVQYVIEWANQLNELTKQYQKLRGQIEQTTNATEREVGRYTVQLSAISKTFDVENQEIINAATALTKQLTGDFSESLKLIEQGFLAGADRGGDFLDQVKEYPAVFREAGLTGEQMIATITQSVQEGVFSDKGADLIKEFTLRIRELPKATQDALEGIGLTSQEIRKEIDENGIGGAFALVQERLKDLKEDSPEVGAALADIFGGPGEDAGIQFVKNLELANANMEDLTDASNEYLQVLQQNFEANEELAEAQNRLTRATSQFSTSMGTTITRVKTFFLNVVSDIFEFFHQLPATVQGVQAAFNAVVNNITSFFERAFITIQTSLKKVEKLNPFGKSSQQLDAEIAALNKKKDALANEVDGVMESYRKAFLEGLRKIEQQDAIAEAFLKPPRQSHIEKNVDGVIEKYDKAVKEKLKAREQEQVQSLDVADEDVTDMIDETMFADEQDLLKNRFLRGIETEAAYHQQRYELQQQEFERRLALLKQQHGMESQQFVQLENEKLEAQRDYEQERENLTMKTEEARRAYVKGGLDALGSFVEDTIGFLQKEGDERKKQGLALKAFSVGKVIIDTEEAIMAIIKNAQANPANILFPGAGNIIQALKIGGVLAKSTSAISKINRTSFYAGGHTGNQVLMPDSHGGIVGGVHKNEWVAPAWQVKDPVAGPVIQWLEGMRRNGYVDGGFVGANSPAAAVARTPTLLDTKQLEKMMQEVRDSNMMVAKAVQEKQFSVMSGQLVDALDEEDRLNRKARF